MFNAYDFTFAGEPSFLYDLFLYEMGDEGQDDVAFGNEGTIIETRLNNRIQPISFGVNYHENPLEFDLLFGSEHPFDRYELEAVANWLTAHQQYQWLSIDQKDLANVQFRCLITSLQPVTYAWLPVAFKAHVVCDCPYAYSYPFEYEYKLNGETSILFRNESSTREYFKPIVTYLPTDGTTLKIVNESDNNREFLLENIPSAAHVTINNTSGLIEDKVNGYNLYEGWNKKFIRFVHGDNVLKATGYGTLTISGRFLRNVAG